MSSIIIVNATAARSSGALSILKQFVSSIPIGIENTYYIFIDPDIILPIKSNNVKLIKINTRRWIDRISWDARGIQKWIRKNNLKPSLVISLQNTGVNLTRDIPQLIYYHQLLPLSNHSWNIIRKEEFILFIYKYFYSFFVSLYIHNNTHFVVQIPSVKKAFLNKYRIDEDNVHIIPPEIPTVEYDSLRHIKFEDEKTHFVYPATLYVYKNHRILLKALQILKERNKDEYRRIKVHLTIRKEDMSSQEGLDEIADAIVFEGVIPFKRLMSYYKSMDALLFPSYIESFGLPLLEAAGVGIPIIASDLPYVHDVVGEYEGTTFVVYNNAKAWADAIIDMCKNKMRYPTFRYSTDKGGWNTFFELVEKLKIK